MDEAGGSQAFPEADVEVFFDKLAGVVPWGSAICVGEEVREGGFGRLEGHGHAVSCEGRDDGMGIPEGEDAGDGFLEAELEASDGGEGVRLPFGVFQ